MCRQLKQNRFENLVTTTNSTQLQIENCKFFIAHFEVQLVLLGKVSDKHIKVL